MDQQDIPQDLPVDQVSQANRLPDLKNQDLNIYLHQVPTKSTFLVADPVIQALVQQQLLTSPHTQDPIQAKALLANLSLLKQR